MMQEFVQRLKDLGQDALDGIHTAIPGKIVSFDAGKGLATVSPCMKYKKPDGSTISYPNITGVPVVFPQGAGQSATIYYPVKAGDGCLLIVSENSLDYWMYGRETASELRFDLTNSVAIVGLFAAAGGGAKEACAQNAIVVSAGGTKLTVSPGGVAVSGSLTVSGTITAGGDVTGAGISLGGHTHTGDSGGSTSTPH